MEIHARCTTIRVCSTPPTLLFFHLFESKIGLHRGLLSRLDRKSPLLSFQVFVGSPLPLSNGIGKRQKRFSYVLKPRIEKVEFR